MLDLLTLAAGPNAPAVPLNLLAWPIEMPEELPETVTTPSLLTIALVVPEELPEAVKTTFALLAVEPLASVLRAYLLSIEAGRVIVSSVNPVTWP